MKTITNVVCSALGSIYCIVYIRDYISQGIACRGMVAATERRHQDMKEEPIVHAHPRSECIRPCIIDKTARVVGVKTDQPTMRYTSSEQSGTERYKR